MRVFVLCGFLLVGAVVAAPATDSSGTMDNYSLGLADMYILDDNENPVKLDLTEDLPETLEETKKVLSKRVYFHLYTRSNPTNSQILPLEDAQALANSNFDPKKETKIVTHGWINSRNSKSCVLVRDAFLKQGDYNVIVIDWSRIAIGPYIWASNRVLMVSQYASKMINFLVTRSMNPSQVTIVGHSLGAHVAGLSSYYSQYKINYVVALDPAQPNFLLAGTGSRVSRGDANYVEVIHTNGGLLGYNNAIGDVDFFPNGGHLQKGCVIDIGGSCSHSRSYEYFAESINTQRGFYARSCSSFMNYELGECENNAEAAMGGEKPQPNVAGKYYLRTNAMSPFALGHA